MLKHIFPAVRATLVLGLMTGIIYPLVMTGLAQVIFPKQANGTLIHNAQGKVIGSELIGQTFNKPEYFHGRPSAAGQGYAGEASSGSNLGPTSDKLINGLKASGPGANDAFTGVKQLAESYRQENGLPADSPVPVEAVTYSGSGLDPHISLQNARVQVKRVATARSLPEMSVNTLVDRYTMGRDLGILGEPRVNVLMLNIALDEMKR